MSPIRIERFIPNTDTWVHMGDVNRGDPNASISANNSDGTRDLYMFGVDGENQQGYIKKSIAGFDEADSEIRVTYSLGFITVATLNPSDSYEIEIITDKSRGELRRIRFVYLEDK